MLEKIPGLVSAPALSYSFPESGRTMTKETNHVGNMSSENKIKSLKPTMEGSEIRKQGENCRN
jgi:hypothetical protein